MSWIWKIGCCFCGCSDDEEDAKPTKIEHKRNYEKIVDQEPLKRLAIKNDRVFPRRKRSTSSMMDSASMSCSGYQTFACTSDSGSQSDDEGSIDLKPTKKRLAALAEEDPSDEMDQVNSQNFSSCHILVIFLFVNLTGGRIGRRNNSYSQVRRREFQANGVHCQLPKPALHQQQKKHK
jgi:hypothetical protein